MKLYLYKFLTFLYCLSLLIYYADETNTVKYFQYILPVVGLLLSMSNWNRFITYGNELSKYLRIIFFILVINSYVLFIHGVFYKFFQEGYLFIGSLFFSVVLVSYAQDKLYKVIDYVFYFCIITLIVTRGTAILAVFSNISNVIAAFLSSQLDTESSLAYFFVLFSFYYYVKKKSIYALLSFFLMVLCFKRIAILAFLITVVIYKILKWMKIKKFRPGLFASVALAFNSGVVAFVLLLAGGNFDNFIKINFGVSSNFLFQGRVALYQDIIAQLGSFSFLGIGIGKIAYTLLVDQKIGMTDTVLVNMHSEIFKYYLEFGLVMFPIFIYSLYCLAKNIYSLCILVILNFIFLTDNVSIYFTFMVGFYIITYELNRFKTENYQLEK